MKILSLRNSADIGNTGARLSANKIRSFAAGQETLVLGLVGGRSTGEIYKQLANIEMPEWKKVLFFWADERALPLSDRQSNYRIADELLLQPLLAKGLIRRKNIYPFPVEKNPETAAKQYTETLNTFGGRFDLLLLGAGEDGHIAGIFPDLIYPQTAEFFYFENSPKSPPQRFTAGPVLLACAKSAILIYSGAEKSPALQHLLDESSKKNIAERTLLEIKDLNILSDQKVHT